MNHATDLDRFVSLLSTILPKQLLSLCSWELDGASRIKKWINPTHCQGRGQTWATAVMGVL